MEWYKSSMIRQRFSWSIACTVSIRFSADRPRTGSAVTAAGLHAATMAPDEIDSWTLPDSRVMVSISSGTARGGAKR